jgi:hypothetical protein
MLKIPTAICIIALAALAGCGADGEPVRPAASSNATVSDTGVRAGGTVGVRKGPWSVSLGRVF